MAGRVSGCFILVRSVEFRRGLTGVFKVRPVVAIFVMSKECRLLRTRGLGTVPGSNVSMAGVEFRRRTFEFVVFIAVVPGLDS